MIWQRVRQVYYALHVHFTPADDRFLDQWLPAPVRQLFAAMSLIDRYHALRTAYTATQLAQQYPAVNLPLLLRCALLHDVGRVAGDLGIVGKSLMVLLQAVCPEWVAKKGHRDGPAGSLQHKLYVYTQHANLGAAKLSQRGWTAEAAIIAKHHKAPAEDDPLELKLLRIADSKN